MTWRLFLIELRHWSRQPMVYIFLFLFALFGFGLVSWDKLVVGGQLANVKLNAPFMVYQYYAAFGFLGLLMVTAFVNASAIRDFANNTQQIMFSTPLKKGQYLLSRFLGSTFVSTLPLLGISLGMILGSVMPWVDPERIGPNDLMAHAQAYLFLSIPNIVFSAAVIFAVAVLVRSTTAAFVTAIVIMVGSGVAESFMTEMDNQTLAAMLDPFGGTAFELVSRYWTVDDKNTMLLPMDGVLLWNRVLWITLAAIVFLLCYWRFSFTDRRTKVASIAPQENGPSAAATIVPTVTKAYDGSARLRQWRRIVWNDLTGMLKGTAFLLVTGIGLLNMFLGLSFSSSLYENTLHPVTYRVNDITEGSFSLFILILITFYAGLLVWKEREPKLDEVHDATPTPLGIGLLGKYTALLLLLALVLAIASLGGMVFQLLNGYTHLEPGVYLGNYILPNLVGLGIMLTLAFLIHVLVNNKYVGYAVFIVFIIGGGIVLNALDIRSHLVQFNSAPGTQYSDMNAFGTAITAWAWFKAYWAACGVVLMALTLFFWIRGKETSWPWRVRMARKRMARNKWILLPALAAWIGLGAWNYYNTKVLNTVMGSDEQEEDAVYYEKTYKKYQGIAQPHYTDIAFMIDLDPHQRILHSVARITVKNKSAVPIDSLHLNMNSVGIVQEVDIPGASLVLNDERVDYRIYKLARPLLPGEELHFTATADHVPKGFENSVSVMQLNENGTFFNNRSLIPTIGYSEGGELQDKNDRRKHELPAKQRMPKLTDDPSQRMDNYLMANSDWVTVRTIISTTPDQIAIAPGSLKREWNENGKRLFEYVVDHPSMNFYSFMSARYDVLREKWIDPNDPSHSVDVEVYYHPTHAENVPRMANSIQKSLSYYSTHFGPYRHKQARIIEFPRYQTFAQAFPGTMPYSEGIGFIADLSDTTDIDMVFYVVAHEMGHQWWAHQVMGADMQGATLLSESMAQYSALMVMEKEYGRAQMRKFLKLESDRYQRSRGSEDLKEVPLLEVENQGYIHYNKGSIVLYGLRDFVGEDSLNQAFRALVDTFGYAEPPYPTALDMYRELEKVVPDSLTYLLEDGFKHITLYNNRVDSATARMLPDSTWEVNLQLWGEKNYADSMGRETPAAMNDWIDVSILRYPKFGAKADKTLNDVPLLQRRVRLVSGRNVLTFTVPEKPLRAEIDRDHLFIDRVMEDNERPIVLDR
ncbi:MAG: ABC transporter permease [Flavobacteriales bacterium]|nr:ABC transporter permease [Flavobacteriales bacterium]